MLFSTPHPRQRAASWSAAACDDPFSALCELEGAGMAGERTASQSYRVDLLTVLGAGCPEVWHAVYKTVN